MPLLYHLHLSGRYGDRSTQELVPAHDSRCTAPLLGSRPHSGRVPSLETRPPQAVGSHRVGGRLPHVSSGMARITHPRACRPSAVIVRGRLTASGYWEWRWARNVGAGGAGRPPKGVVRIAHASSVVGAEPEKERTRVAHPAVEEAAHQGSRDRRTSACLPVQLMTALHSQAAVGHYDVDAPACAVGRPDTAGHDRQVGSVRQSPTRPIARRNWGARHRRPDASRQPRRRSSGPRRPASAPFAGSVGQRAAQSGPPDQRRKRRATPRRRAAIWFRRSTVENTGVDAGRCVRASAASTTIVLGIDAFFGRT